MLYEEVKERRRKLIDFIKKNPKTTHKEIKNKLHLKVEKVYSGGMEEAFKEAGVRPPRTFKIKTKEEKIDILLSYIRKNPLAGGHTIRKDTKINFRTLFKNTKELFDLAGVEYTREKRRKLLNRDPGDRKKEIVELIRKNPLISISDIAAHTRTHPYRVFKSISEIYKVAKVDFVGRSEKRRLKKAEKILNFIKKNPLATQREINRSCKTHVQTIFKKGIFEAYEKAGVEFPYQRINLHRSSIKSIGLRAKKFEEEIALKLSGYGKVNRLVKTGRGFADIVLERKDSKAVLEIKDYFAHEISVSQVKQLNKYLENSDCKLGFLICRKKPKKDIFLMGNNKIHILEDSEINKVPVIMDLGA
ncbi:MAG: hypothetical protein AABY10_04105 [Nanoarchaeota archaeon]